MTQPLSTKVINVPNSLSTLRLLLSLVVGLLIEYGYFLSAAVLFLIAASTDFVDGYWARRYNQITKLGRVLDPFVDKVIILASITPLVAYSESGFRAWMVTVVIGRELLVTSLRSMVEGKGGDFSARSLGKWKMFAQCAAVLSSLLVLSKIIKGDWLVWANQGFIWIAIGLTVTSGADYVRQIVKLSRSTT